MDIDGPFCPTRMTRDTMLEVRQRLASFESMTWGEIGSTGSHPIPVSDLSADAQRRLGEIRQDDVEQLYSLRVSGTERVFGIREGGVLRILWWDPSHQVAPTAMKHT